MVFAGLWRVTELPRELGGTAFGASGVEAT
jgi:hypothetical protein